MPVTDKELVLAKVPEQPASYAGWRMALVLKLMSYMPLDAEASYLFIEELDVLDFEQLDEAPLPPTLKLYDARLYSAVMTAAAVHHTDLTLRIVEVVRLGCGREAVKVIDAAMHFDSVHLAIAGAQYLSGAASSSPVTHM